MSTPRSTTGRTQSKARLPRALLAAGTGLAMFILSGCETDSWFDPSRTGCFEFTPTTMPILDRIDVVEKETRGWGQVTPPSTDDLEPGDLQYRLTAGDEIRVEVFELVTQGQTDVALRTVDPSGNIRLPTIGEIPAGGLTVAQVQKEIETRLKALINDPIVSVVLERGQGFSFTVYGAVAQPGVFGLSRPDFHLIEALALAGGTGYGTERVYVIRTQPLENRFRPAYGDRGLQPGVGEGEKPSDQPKVDIDELINRLEQGGAKPPEAPPSTPPAANPGATPPPGGPASSPSPGALGPRQDAGQTKPPIDVDDLSQKQPTPPPPPAAGTGDAWVWDAAKQEWVRGQGSTAVPAPPSAATGAGSQAQSLFATRVIEVDYKALARGETNLNVIVRPGDQIYVDPPAEGVVYIDGEIIRPGVYELPRSGQLTLSRLIAAAGGLGQIAIPSRVDLIRKIAPAREAIVRVDLGAIRNRNEPDLVLKPDDHVIIGTNFFATPLAVIRNGFRMTYGFGFLIDRNFGNDVFGPPPTNVLGE